MDKFIVAKISVVIILMLFPFAQSFAAKPDSSVRNINIAGLVFNSETLLPVEGAAIYDTQNNLLGSTDSNGYFKVTIVYKESGELYFTLNIKKQGYRAFTEKEHWGNFGGDSKTVLYFGLEAQGSNGSLYSSFSAFGNHGSDLSYENVLAGFNKVKEQKVFNDKLKLSEAGNEKVLIQLDSNFYIVDNGGWVPITSDKDIVLLNNKQGVVADQLNETLKRRNITGLSLTNINGKKEVIIFTK